MDAVEQPSPATPARPWRWRPWPTCSGPVPPAQPRQSGLARPRPVRPLLRPRLDAAVCPAPPDGIRPAARRAARSGSGARGRRAIPSADTRPASRPPPGRSARASATPSAWRSPSDSSPSASTGRAPIVDHRTWAFVSDGDLMEGVASEAASLAGHLRLGKLTLIYDDNHITIDGDTALSFSEDVGRALRGLRLARAAGRRRQRPRGHRRARSRRRAPRPRVRR